MPKSAPHTVARPVILAAMILGILSAIAFRSLLVLDTVYPGLVVPVWYFAVVGYFFFFLYRYWISRKRKRAISDYQLIEKVNAGQCLQGEDREVLVYLLSSISLSREDINYYIIFVLSIGAMALDMYMRFA